MNDVVKYFITSSVTKFQETEAFIDLNVMRSCASQPVKIRPHSGHGPPKFSQLKVLTSSFPSAPMTVVISQRNWPIRNVLPNCYQILSFAYSTQNLSNYHTNYLIQFWILSVVNDKQTTVVIVFI